MVHENALSDPVRLNSDRASLLEENELLREKLAEAESQIANLQIALGTSRQIGAAIGILMTQRQLTSDDAFEVLRSASQTRNVKIRDLAADVLYTGILAD